MNKECEDEDLNHISAEEEVTEKHQLSPELRAEQLRKYRRRRKSDESTPESWWRW